MDTLLCPSSASGTRFNVRSVVRVSCFVVRVACWAEKPRFVTREGARGEAIRRSLTTSISHRSHPSGHSAPAATSISH